MEVHLARHLRRAPGASSPPLIGGGGAVTEPRRVVYGEDTIKRDVQPCDDDVCVGGSDARNMALEALDVGVLERDGHAPACRPCGAEFPCHRTQRTDECMAGHATTLRC